MSDRDDYARLDQSLLQARCAKIAQLNDAFRRGLSTGRLAITRGVLALGTNAAANVLAQVRAFDDFADGNDPYGEHDFGALTHEDTVIFWKIDYYDSDMHGGSPDPADAAVTTRVLTVMLAAEY